MGTTFRGKCNVSVQSNIVGSNGGMTKLNARMQKGNDDSCFGLNGQTSPMKRDAFKG